MTRTRDAEAFAARLRGVFEGFELRGLSQRQMVAELNALGIRAPRGGSWRLKQVQRVRARIARARTRSSHSSIYDFTERASANQSVSLELQFPRLDKLLP